MQIGRIRTPEYDKVREQKLFRTVDFALLANLSGFEISVIPREKIQNCCHGSIGHNRWLTRQTFVIFH